MQIILRSKKEIHYANIINVEKERMNQQEVKIIRIKTKNKHKNGNTEKKFMI